MSCGLPFRFVPSILIRMKTLFKIVAFLLVYLTIGVAVTNHRARVERWSSGGPGIIVVYLIYPIGYPAFELMRLADRVEERFFLADSRRDRVNNACPPEYAGLLGEGVLAKDAEREGADYREFLRVLRKRGLKRDDPRTGYVLERLSLVAAAHDDPGAVRADAEAFLATADGGDVTALWVAAALLRGVYGAAPDDRETLDPALAAYRRAYASMEPTELPYGAHALGTVCEAAGMRAEALAHYTEAVKSGRIELGMRALVRAAPLAADDAARRELLEAFFRAIDYPGWKDRIEEWPDKALLGATDIDKLRFHDQLDLATLTLGRHLFPLRTPSPDAGGRFEAFVRERLYDGRYVVRLERWWEELAVALEPAFSDFPAKLAMVERILDEAMDLGRYSEYFDERDISRTVPRETYYRLYAETGEGRWLDEAVASQIRLRPRLAPYETYLRSEVAFMRGEYRRHLDLLVEAMLTHETQYRMTPKSWGYLRRRMDRLRVYVGERDERYYYVMEWHLGKVSEKLYQGKWDGLTAEEMLRRYRSGEIEPPFGDFRDEDVREVEGR